MSRKFGKPSFLKTKKGSDMTQLRVTLNGTLRNPFLRLGLIQNPFPQIAKAELVDAIAALNSLAAKPIEGVEDIRSRLAGKLSEEFIDLCCLRYRKGQMVSFLVGWKDAE